MENRIEILLFEDNPGDAGLIEEMLEEFAYFQYELKIVETLNEGLILLRENPFDIILSDLGLPDSDGIDTFLEIHARNSRIPIIILTGMSNEKIGIDAVKKGAQDYIVKGQVDGRLLRRSIQYSIERKKTEEKAQNLANIVESSNDAIVTRSLDGFITSWNLGAEQIYGYSAEEILGKSAAILIPCTLENETQNLTEMVKQGEKIHQYETSRLRKDGKIIDVSITFSPVFDMSGELMAISVIARDITESKKAEEKLQKSEERYRIVTEQTGQIVYEYDPEENKIYWAGAIEKVTGYTQEELQNAGLNLWINNVHPEDQKNLWDQKIKNCDQNVKCSENKRNFKLEYCFRKRDGKYIHIEDHGVYLQKGNYLTNKVLGIMKDITERKEAESFRKKIEEARKKEIHHRIKNNLQVISSLLDLQAEKFTQEEVCDTSKILAAFRDSQNRVISMALIHEELYGSKEVNTLNFAVYLRKLTEELFKCYNVGVSEIDMLLEIEENIFFDMDTAVPLGMIVNELVSNSLKHAFPDGRNGKIQIKLLKEINGISENCNSKSENFNLESENGKFEIKNEECKSIGYILTVSDNGIGIPESISLEDSDTLGMQLVTILIEQLNGEFELNRACGTEFVIKFTVTEDYKKIC
jgi:PAS domain S-box-containing protein